MGATKEASNIEVVINNAGILTVSNLLKDLAISNLEHEIECKCLWSLDMAQAFAPVLKANSSGVFMQLNSIASIKSFSNFST
jgi:NADP-dependent 3-hydroxy acid dehydrogenase YdfG